MADRLVAMGFPIDWCECALKNSSSLDAAVQQLRQWQQQARRGCTVQVQEHADSNSLTPRSPHGRAPTASVSFSESTGGSTNCVRMFPVTSNADAVVPQFVPSELNHQQVPRTERQESDSSPKRKPCAAELESDSTRKVFRKNNSKSTPVGSSLKSTPVGSNLRSAPAFSVVATAEAPRVQAAPAPAAPPGSIRVDETTSKMDSSDDFTKAHSQPAGGPSYAPTGGYERGRAGRNGGSLDLDGERVRLRDLAFQSAALRMSEAAQIFRGGLQPDVGEIGPAFEFPMCQDDDNDGVDEGWTSIMEIDEPQAHRVSADHLREADLMFAPSVGTSSEDDNRSVDGPQCAPDGQPGVAAANQRLKCVLNQQPDHYAGQHANWGQDAKCRGRVASSSWCPDPPRKLQRTGYYPHDPGIGSAGDASGSGSFEWRAHRKPGLAEREDNEMHSEGKAGG